MLQIEREKCASIFRYIELHGRYTMSSVEGIALDISALFRELGPVSLSNLPSLLAHRPELVDRQ
jgi:hypothetical protein